MAVEFARAGFPSVGLDVDRPPRSNTSVRVAVPCLERRRRRNCGRCAWTTGSSASTDPRVLDTRRCGGDLRADAADAQSGGPDLRFVQSAGTTIGEHLHPDMLVVLQSTCGPGTTSQELAPLLEHASGLRAGEDFFIVFAPERIDPGNQRFTVKNTPKLVGGTDARVDPPGVPAVRGVHRRSRAGQLT